MDQNTIGIICAFISLAGLSASYYYASRIYMRTRAKLKDLYVRIEYLSSTSKEMAAQMESIKASLDSKITRGAMQSVTKQAKELTSAVISQNS